MTEGKSLKTIDKVNHLNILTGDKILFKCGDIWRGEMLIITKSGAMNNPVTFGSFPEGCANKPVLSGSRPIDGWVLYSGNIYVADLSAGTNAGKFPLGINQVFRNGTRLPIGRWSNPEADDLGGQYHNGYSVIDGQTASNKITDNQLPAVDWTGGTAHIKGMRWYILNRDITAKSGSVLTLNTDAVCWGSSCTGWGFAAV